MTIGETDLATLLRTLEPVLDGNEWVFVRVEDSEVPKYMPHALASFREKEGMTLVIPRMKATEVQHSSGPMARITLAVHSSLEAVGLTAAVSRTLANDGISANMIAAYHHDHVFVPLALADRAMNCLHGLSRAGTSFYH
jgi:hypothetical protein